MKVNSAASLVRIVLTNPIIRQLEFTRTLAEGLHRNRTRTGQGFGAGVFVTDRKVEFEMTSAARLASIITAAPR